MPKADERSRGDRLGQEDGEVRAAIRFTLLAAAAAVGFVIMAALWVSTCPGTGVDTVAWGEAPRTPLAGTWWGWHGAGWFLLTLMIVTVSMSVPAIAGPVLAP
jgi:hypothetical protein